MSKFQFNFFFHILFQHLIVYSFCNLSKFFFSNYLKSRSMPHILGRRFALTTTSYKYVDVEINVGPMSSVEIIIDDNRGNQIVTS